MSSEAVLERQRFFPAAHQAPLARKGHPGMYALGVAVTVLSSAAFVAANIVTFPLSGPISLLALGILTSTTYGIINDQFACRQCIQYFTVGHTQVHKRLLETDDPTLNGIVWGIHATWQLGAVAGVLMAAAALATKLVVSRVLPFLVPVLAVGVAAICLYAHIQAKREEEKWNRIEKQDELNDHFNDRVIHPLQGTDYHRVNLDEVPVDKRAAYMGVGKRNAIGYTAMPALGGVTLVAIIALGILL